MEEYGKGDLDALLNDSFPLLSFKISIKEGHPSFFFLLGLRMRLVVQLGLEYISKHVWRYILRHVLTHEHQL